MDTGLMARGFELMLFGMTAVGLFLTLLVVAVTLSARVMQRWFPESEPAPAPRRSGQPSTPAAGAPAPEVVAAIAAALHQHRSQRH